MTSEIDAVTTRLVARYAERLPLEVVRRNVEEAFAAVRAQARIESYIPILAERAAATRLAEFAEWADQQ